MFSVTQDKVSAAWGGEHTTSNITQLPERDQGDPSDLSFMEYSAKRH